MDAEANTRTLKQLFAAFQSGDIDGVLERLSEDVEWVTPGSPAVPYAGAYRGREDVARFLAILDSELDYEFWESREFIAQGDTVAVVGAERWRARRTGQVVDNPWVIVFTLRDGKVARFRNFEDTAAVAAAFQPVAQPI
jgi:uncharacterized protein